MTVAEEADVDLGRYGRALAARWWLVVAGLVAGAVLGYVASLGGSRVYRAQAVVYLGQPLGILGGNQVQSLNTNPSTARAIVKSEATIRRVSAATGLRPGQLRSGTSVTAIAGNVAKLGQNPLMQVTVQGHQGAKVRGAANLMATILVQKLSAYSNAKIATLTQQLDSDQKALDAANAALSGSSLSTTEKLIVQLRVSQLESDKTQATQLLSLAKNVEAPRVVTHAVASKTAARNHRNSTAVGGLIGLILGVLAAILWEPVVRRTRGG
jgi:Chain length determinant protein